MLPQPPQSFVCQFNELCAEDGTCAPVTETATVNLTGETLTFQTQSLPIVSVAQTRLMTKAIARSETSELTFELRKRRVSSDNEARLRAVVLDADEKDLGGYYGTCEMPA